MNVKSHIDPVSEAYKTNRFLYFDLETIPCQGPDYLQYLERKVEAPARLKKPESINHS